MILARMHPRRPPAAWIAAVVVSLTSLPAPRARAQVGDDALDEAATDGDVDREDRAALRLGAREATGDVHGQSWVSLVGISRRLSSGRTDLGAMVVVGLALDRLAAGPVHRIGDPAAPAAAPTRSTADEPALVSSALARECVAAALRASGLGVDDASLDALVARSRVSAWLPETRMRAMRLLTDAQHATTLATTDGTTLYDAVGANLVLELRLTWRFDRLLYAGDEPTIERVRLERLEARSRLATKVLELLFGWRRAVVDSRAAPQGSREELEARLRASEALATLDVLTGGLLSRKDTERGE